MDKEKVRELIPEMVRLLITYEIEVTAYQTAYDAVVNGGGGDASTAGTMVGLAGEAMAVQQHGMQRIQSSEFRFSFRCLAAGSIYLKIC
jgi:hypothetical protein